MCAAWSEVRTEIRSANLKGKDQLEDRRVDGRTVLKLLLQKSDGRN
jgi:hypothetical protein